MVWYKDLYVGRLISRRKDAVIDEIEHGRYPAGVYVITVPENENRQLEIMAAGELKHGFIKEHTLMIVGIAMGKTEAEGILERMAGDVYADRGDVNFRAWLMTKHG